MNCREIKEKIWQVFDREIPVDEKNLVEKHVKECKECRKLHTQVQEMLKTVRNFPQDKAPDDFTQRLKNRIVQTYGYPAQTKKMRVSMARYGFSFALGAAVVLAVFFFTKKESEPMLRYLSPGQSIKLAGYERTSSFLKEKSGYIRMKFTSAKKLNDVSVEIDLPEGLTLVNGDKTVLWQGDLRKGRNVILFQVKGQTQGQWEINGVLRKNGLEKSFKKSVTII